MQDTASEFKPIVDGLKMNGTDGVILYISSIEERWLKTLEEEPRFLSGNGLPMNMDKLSKSNISFIYGFST